MILNLLLILSADVASRSELEKVRGRRYYGKHRNESEEEKTVTLFETKVCVFENHFLW